MAKHKLLKEYNALRDAGKIKRYSPEVEKILTLIYKESMNFLQTAKRIDLTSKVDNKRYFAFQMKRNISRAINSDLYNPDFSEWQDLRHCMSKDSLDSFTVERLSQVLYTMAISFCACIDLLKSGDRKTPGTFFEYFTAYFFTWRLGVEPQTSIPLLAIDEEDTNLPTDYIFNLGKKKPKFHLPVKTSTRERSIMLWAHQKLLDGVYGIERFMGTPIIMNEVKTSISRREVTEICLPEQWRLYQLYIAQLKRIYYLDLPAAYENLHREFPPIQVKPFAEFFFEWNKLLPE